MLDTQSALRNARFDEFLFSYLRCARLIRDIADEESDNDDDDEDNLLIPTWHGAHALISTVKVPLMRVSFGPVIPFPVTDYAMVRNQLKISKA